MPEPESQPPAPGTALLSRAYLVLLVLAGGIGLAVSFAAGGFEELVYQIQQEVFHHLPSGLGYHHGPPLWWSLPVLAIAGLIVAFAIVRLPGKGGHLPAEGLQPGGATDPITVPGVALAGLASIGLGTVVGPEAPLIAIGAGLAVAAISLIFTSPIIAAILMIEVIGLGGERLRLVLLPGLLAAGIGSLVSIGMGSWTGLSTSAYALGQLPLEHFARPTWGQFAWSIALALAVALVAHLIKQGGLGAYRVVRSRLFLTLPLAGLAVSGLAIAFSEASGKSVEEVLFSGQNELPGLLSQAPSWSLGALALLILFKGIAYSISLGSFRGGPTFPALFLGAAAGLMASHLVGMPASAGVDVCMGAAIVSILRLPLSAIVIVAYLATLALARSRAAVFGSERPVAATEGPRAQTATGSPPSPAPAAGRGL